MSTAPMLFADFTPGDPIGETSVVLDGKLLDAWAALYAAASRSGPVTPGMVQMLMMRGYIAVVRRPQGNIHSGETLQIHFLPASYATVSIRVSCVSKELRKGRHWVEFGIVGEVEGDGECFDGQIRMLWAR